MSDSKNAPVVLILGATSDTGAALARKFAEEKFAIQLAGRDMAGLERIAADIAIRTGATVSSHRFDAMDFRSHQGFYDSLPGRPDVCICVFGYLGDQAKGETDWVECERILNTNYTGAVSVLNVAARRMTERKAGTIIGISSVAGERGRQSNYLYGSAKAGFTAYLSGLRNKLSKDNVHVMTVKPGFMDTKMTEGLTLPPALTAQPHQVARAIYRGYARKKNGMYVLGRWRWIMLVIKLIPEPVFKKLKL